MLGRRRIEAVVLERGSDLATRWRTAYDRLHINTSSWFSYLPGQRLPRQAGRWLSRDDLITYYRDYARRNRLRVETGVQAETVQPVHGRWRVETSAGEYFARVVVVATGKQHSPVVPDWPGRQDFRGELIHSADYRNASPFTGKRALVVGAGNSGMDIALDLLEGGAASVGLSIRRAPHILRRQVLGLPHDLFGVTSRGAPRRVVDRNAKLLRRFVVGDLSEFGLPIPDDGPVTRLEEEGRVPTVDPGDFVAAVGAGQIAVVPGVVRFEDHAVKLSDGRALPVDVVVAATGFRPDLRGLVGHLGILDGAGQPLVRAQDEHPSAPGLHFIGFIDPRSGHLRELRLEASRVAKAVSRRLEESDRNGDRLSPSESLTEAQGGVGA